MPRVTVLQLDTNFRRIAGDIGCPETFTEPPQILKISGAAVANIVTDKPQAIDIAPFRTALAKATGDIVTTSCGFLSFWQDSLAKAAHKPFVASALSALPQLAQHFTPEELLIITFDAEKLNATHLQGHPEFTPSIHGLPEHAHLRAVIGNDLQTLDQTQAAAELITLIGSAIHAKTRAILLECTNLPPYKPAITKAFNLPIYDILTTIEITCPNTIAPKHLPPPIPRG